MAFCPICGRSHDPDIGCSDATGQAIRDMGLPRAMRRHSDNLSSGRLDYKRTTLWVIAMSSVFLLILWLLRVVF